MIVLINLLIYFTLRYCIGFAIHWFESAISVHVLPPILNPPPTFLPSHPSGSSQRTRPEHPVSCIKPGLAIRFHMIIYMFQCHSPISSYPRPLPQNPKDFYTSVSLLLFRIQGYHYHLSKFHIYALVYCIGVFLSALLHSVYTFTV